MCLEYRNPNELGMTSGLAIIYMNRIHFRLNFSRTNGISSTRYRHGNWHLLLFFGRVRVLGPHIRCNRKAFTTTVANRCTAAPEHDVGSCSMWTLGVAWSLIQQSNESNESNENKISVLASRYSTGWFPGSDGMIHRGIGGHHTRIRLSRQTRPGSHGLFPLEVCPIWGCQGYIRMWGALFETAQGFLVGKRYACPRIPGYQVRAVSGNMADTRARAIILVEGMGLRNCTWCSLGIRPMSPG
ncbi:hypothetical protein BJ166DRAFT_183186 [Pestalotiopsis sp. NC0098]|nr:hypothetical protein BJ166DRAFT_183186 [Pestalotiopsis sp. NC0098]